MRKIGLMIFLVLIICGFGYKTYSLSKSVKSEALERSKKTNVEILKSIEDSISLCSVEYDYEDYITRKKTWALDLNPSIKYAKFTGKIKVGCEIKSIKEQSNIFLIVLSDPAIVQHELNRIGEWRGKEGIWNNFTPVEEGKVISEQKKRIADKIFDKLQEEDKKRNKELVSDLLVKSGVNGDSFRITYEKK